MSGVDYVVVGAGSAGCAVAAGLVERTEAHVLLLEAGPEARDPRIAIPALASDLWFGRNDWAYVTEPQAGLDRRRDTWPRGRVVGGSSAINAMMWVRGLDVDFNGWEAGGATGWGADRMNGLFRSIEDDERGLSTTRGVGGPMRVERQRDPRPLTLAFLDACAELGIRVVDDYHAQPDGAALTMVTQRRGRRVTAADAFLAPHRPGRGPSRGRAPLGPGRLTVRTGVTVGRVIVRDGRAVGVEVHRGGRTQIVLARREVILSAGAVATPALLMRSGIGPIDVLREHGIDVVVERAAVGSDLQDHVASGMAVGTAGGSLYGADRDPRVLARWVASRRGPATSNIGEAVAFLRTDEREPAPDLELLAIPAALLDHGRTRFRQHGMTVIAIVLTPESRGRVTLRSADPAAPPIIDPGTFTDPGDRDLARMVSGLRTVQALLTETRALGGRVDARLSPTRHLTHAADLRAHARATGQTLYHPVGTCRMGSDDDAVVDPELKVRGVAGLRVADASVMPRIVRGHTNAASIAIGVRAGELVATATAV
jgi:choline dehydrogenase